ncbi:MAG TPA: hypothetical protein VHP14_13625, partial [Anaerolineales bacterium]|nr:hypothetical protein [Anaerolineales bacterium]
MKYKTLLGAMLLLALLITACGPATTASPTLVPTMVVTEPSMTETMAATEPATATGPAVTESPVATEPGGTGVPVTGEATVNVATVGTYGQALVDGNGNALYVFTDDTQNATTSACTGDCAAAWPPLASQGSPQAGTGVDATLLSTVTRDDGTLQVTYNGW